MHIDIHGRTDTYIKNSDIELGTMPMKRSKLKHHRAIINSLVPTFEEKMNKVFVGQELNGYPVRCTSICNL